MTSSIRSLLAVLAALMLATASPAFALDINNASTDDLLQVKGVGPVIARRIASERRKGRFKSQADLQERVPGVGPQIAENLGKGSGLPKGTASKGKSTRSAASIRAKGKVIEVATSSKGDASKTGARAKKKTNSKSQPTKR